MSSEALAATSGNDGNSDAVANSPPREDSTDTIFISNLPESFTRKQLSEWCSANFTTLPDKVLVKKPRTRNGEQATTRFGFLKFQDSGLAQATLELLQDTTDPFTVGDEVVDAKWAYALRPRPARAEAAEGGSAKKKRGRRKPRSKDKEGGAEIANAAGGDEEGAADAGKKKKKTRRRKKKPVEEPVEEQDMTGRVYIKNFGSEEALNELLAAHGSVTNVELKEVRRGPGAGTPFAFATYESQDQANAAVAAYAVPEGEEAADGAPILALARPRRVRRPRAENTANRLAEPSKQDLCCRNLPFAMTDEELANIFDGFSSVNGAYIVTTRSGRSRGYGFVHFEDEAEAASAQTDLNGKEVGQSLNGDALLLRLDFATSAPRPPKPAAEGDEEEAKEE